MEKKRSVGGTIFAVLLIIWGICGFTGAFLMAGYSYITGIGVNLAKPQLIICLLLYIPALISGIGALLLTSWARRLLIYLSVLFFGVCIFLIIVWAIGVVYVLTHPDINLARGQIMDGVLWFLNLGGAIKLFWFFLRPSVK